MKLRDLKKILFAALAVFCLAEALHCESFGAEQCAKAGCAAHCCIAARAVEPAAEIAGPAEGPQYRPTTPETPLSLPFPEDIFHPPAA